MSGVSANFSDLCLCEVSDLSHVFLLILVFLYPFFDPKLNSTLISIEYLCYRENLIIP